MKKFLVIYRMDMDAMKKMMANSTPEMQKKGMEDWQKWMDANKAMFADPGAPAGKNTEVSANGSMQKSNDVGGYSVVNADSVDAVAEMLKSSPHFQMPGSTCDVMELMDM
jgi:hypothetical protein